MPAPLFIIFGALTVVFALAVVVNRNPVTASLCLVVSFIGLAGLFIGLSAFFIGIVQILVYAGAVMVLFVFIIMLMDVEEESKKTFTKARIFGGVLVGCGMAFLIVGAIWDFDHGATQLSDVPIQYETAVNLRLAAEGSGVVHSAAATEALAEGRLKDVALVGEKLFNDYNLHLQMIGVLLLVSTVGVVTLSKKDGEAVLEEEPTSAATDTTDDSTQPEPEAAS